jgi:hypothetical protein
MLLYLGSCLFVEVLKVIPLLKAASNMRSLTVDTIAYEGHELDLAKLDLSSILHGSERPITLANLETLTIWSVDCLRLIHVPNIVELRIYKYNRMTAHADPLVLKEDFGKRLKKLTTHCDPFAKVMELREGSKLEGRVTEKSGGSAGVEGTKWSGWR